ncbi:MAG: hypothetical protein VYE43_04035 [Pseudomonadota bacterium]|nr:hypothetical protein [Pseudomonadota bacterium]MEC8877208.1 hypothetical protein [Pseudomonadota bacterium]MED5339589.1 hypothetical protein [Pseudomonadota bacterium]MEE3206491.1 hypothetical protein [Pseudomonadota bacterium]
MTIVVVGIIASYIILTAMLLIFSLRTNFHWGIKTATVIVVSIFYITSYLAFFSILGWPSARDLPETFRLISAQINEPNKITGMSGKVYLWVTPLNENSGITIPRSYQLEYNPELHRIIAEAKVKIKNDVPQIGEIKNKEDSLAIREQAKTKYTVYKASKIRFYDAPTTGMPEK